MDLALNNLQRLICHKTQETNQQSDNFVYFSYVRFRLKFKICMIIELSTFPILYIYLLVLGLKRYEVFFLS